jgi:hypothetical protein
MTALIDAPSRCAYCGLELRAIAARACPEHADLPDLDEDLVGQLLHAVRRAREPEAASPHKERSSVA